MNPVVKWIILAGIFLIVAGLIIHFGGRIFHLGKLPGDIIIERDNFRLYFPITTLILISIILSILFTLFRNFFR